MLKLGTVFSGIGAIEHALKRLGIDFECTFACDNGGVDIFSKKIERNIECIQLEINSLEKRLANIRNEKFKDDDYALSLNDHLEYIKFSLKNLKNISVNLGNNLAENKVLMSIIQKFLKFLRQGNFIVKLSNRLEKYAKMDFLEIPTQDYYFLVNELRIFYKSNKDNYELKTQLEISYNGFEEFIKDLSEVFQVKEVKEIINELISIINMLHERITTLESLLYLSNISDYKEKKKYVDGLYVNKEKSNFVKKSYLANYRIDEDHFHWNASFLDGVQYKDKIDLLVGGSPCQSFSSVGKRKGLQDTRGTLFYEFARLINEIQPKVFIYENVKGLLGHDGGNTWATMQQVFKDLNYDWEFEILNAKNYGIPQNRERLFVVGFRKDLHLKENFEFPKVKTLTKTMKDFLLDNVSSQYYFNTKGIEIITEKRVNKEGLRNVLGKYFLSEKVRKYVMASGTKNFYSRPEIDLDIARPLLTTMHKMHRAGVDNYVTTEGRIRKLAPRECLRLMGFCDSFKIVVSDTQVYQQAGNSIVVDVLISLFTSIVTSLPELLTGEEYKYKEQSAMKTNKSASL
ncbi:DNA cytosine methyltransferase [Priestia aryabhattai]|uniref:DNA cytosine methyltransferase n=1 Tax=Priestia aryabhattai TaxID=412384 RepID=UPI003670D37A